MHHDERAPGRRLLAPRPFRNAGAVSSPLQIIVVAMAMFGVWLNVGPVNDFDSFWHVVIGQEIVQTRSLDDLGLSWLAVPSPPWLTSQWLSEVMMGLAQEAWGWRSLVLARLLVLCVLYVIVTATLTYRRLSISSTLVTLLVFLELAGTTQDRPQSLSFVFIALLAATAHRLLTRLAAPPTAIIAIASFCWAQVHGLWVLGPISFALVAGALMLEDRTFRSPAARASATALVASLCGLLNPHGPGSFLLPLRFQQATGVISEWFPTTFTTLLGGLWALLLLLTFIGWARSRHPVPVSEIIWVIVWTGFGILAYRNVIPSVLMIAPCAVSALHRAFPPPQRPAVSDRESRLLSSLAIVIVAVGAIGVTVKARSTDPLENVPAFSIARWVAGQSGPIRVYNAYNASGSLIAFSDRKARLVIDGRADKWGAGYIEHVTGVEGLAPGWEARLAAFRPDAIVTGRDSPLARVLLREKRWRVQMPDHKFVLLVPARGR